MADESHYETPDGTPGDGDGQQEEEFGSAASQVQQVTGNFDRRGTVLILIKKFHEVIFRLIC